MADRQEEPATEARDALISILTVCGLEGQDPTNTALAFQMIRDFARPAYEAAIEREAQADRPNTHNDPGTSVANDDGTTTWSPSRAEREAQGEQPAPLDVALVALDRLYEAATVEEEDVTHRTHDELVAALTQAGAVLSGHRVPAPLDVERLARVMYDADPNYLGLGMGPKVEWDELTDQTRGQLVVDAADIAIRYERSLSNQPSTEPAQRDDCPELDGCYERMVEEHAAPEASE